ncbi:hypothetical protein Sxan_03510 [Streptomyces xanthophaeus]|uniref:Uncharacterized protein n=1 Tax=Streptomyces xanthophaeus TaxID=67385 RepID=A0A919GU42_9ACTN|nr:hypothetical protein Sxan_03510 [Streptomyces xanthophaeus]
MDVSEPDPAGPVACATWTALARRVGRGGTVLPADLPVVKAEGAVMATYIPANPAAAKDLLQQADGNQPSTPSAVKPFGTMAPLAQGSKATYGGADARPGSGPAVRSSRPC